MTLLIMVVALIGATPARDCTDSSMPAEDPRVSAAKEVPLRGDSLPEGAVARLGTLRFNHGSDLKGVAFALDGRRLVSLGTHGLIRVWETSSARELFTIGGAPVPSSCFAVAADGRSLVTSGQDSQFRLWDLETGRELRQLQPPGAKSFFGSMALSPDGKMLAAAGINNKSTSLWDLEQFNQPRQLVGDERSVWDIVFSRDGKMVATAAMDGIPPDFATSGPRDPEKDRERGSVRLWDVAKDTQTWRFPVVGCHPRCIAFSPDSKILAAGFSDMAIRLYDTAAGTEIARLKVEGPMQGVLAFSPDGRVLASGTCPHRTTSGVPANIHMWDVKSRKELRSFPAHDQRITGLAFSPDGKTLASCGFDVTIRLWDAATGNEINPSSAQRTGITCVAVSPTDNIVITGGADGTIRKWDPIAGRELGRIGPLPRPVHDLAIVPVAGYSCRPVSVGLDRFACGTSTPVRSFIVSSTPVAYGASAVWLSHPTAGSRPRTVKSGTSPRAGRSSRCEMTKGRHSRRGVLTPSCTPWMVSG